MPYRRLPNTDAARIRALKAALKKGQYLEIDTIAYPFALKQKIEFFLPKFEVAITNSKLAKEKQFDNSQKFSEYTKKARLYISHFIQVLNFCIARGELKPLDDVHSFLVFIADFLLGTLDLDSYCFYPLKDLT